MKCLSLKDLGHLPDPDRPSALVWWHSSHGEEATSQQPGGWCDCCCCSCWRLRPALDGQMDGRCGRTTTEVSRQLGLRASLRLTPSASQPLSASGFLLTTAFFTSPGHSSQETQTPDCKPAEGEGQRSVSSLLVFLKQPPSDEL